MNIPEGWKLVPITPTAAMKEAAESVSWPDMEGCSWIEFYNALHQCYTAMVTAAPDPQSK
jgi:hypothetical protein